MEAETVLRLLLFFALLALSGFFSGSETAMFSLSPVQLMKLEEDRHPRARLLRSLLEQPRRLIATIFIGNELVAIGASALLATTTASLLPQRSQIVVTLVSTAISVVLILLLGEITPKNIAARVVERWAATAARPLWLLAIGMAPLRVVIERIADLAVRLFGRRGEARGGGGPGRTLVGEDEFLTMVDAVKEEGVIDESEQKLIHNIFAFGDRRVAEVMTPAERVFMLSANLPMARILSEVRASQYSRIPIYQGSRDRIVGLIYAKDLIPIAFGQAGRGRRLQDLLHPGYFVPKTVKCEQLLREFRQRKIHISLVVDEYGHFVGLITMEDLLEEMFGEIKDEKELPAPTDEFQVVDPAPAGGGPPEGGAP
jgi:putative hemolysin